MKKFIKPNCKVIVSNNGARIIFGKLVLNCVNNSGLFLFQGELSHVEALGSVRYRENIWHQRLALGHLNKKGLNIRDYQIQTKCVKYV